MPESNTLKEGYTRVTTVLSPFSGLSHIDPVILQRAADRGTAVHLLCDAYIEGFGVPMVSERISGYYSSFEQWADGKKFHPKPERFYDDDRMLTGECDAIIETDQGLTLIDFKTSAKEGKTWPLQGCAYAEMAAKLGCNIQAIQFVKLCKDGKEPKIFTYDYNKHLPMWHKCFDVYKEFFSNNEFNYEDLL